MYPSHSGTILLGACRVSLCLPICMLFLSGFSEQAISQSQDEQPFNLWIEPINAPENPGGQIPPWSESPSARGGTPNIAITSVVIVNVSNVPITPTAGKRFWVRATWSYTNSLCTPYSVGRVVNGWEENKAPDVTWGCGNGGTTNWVHVWGAWVMHTTGTYSVTVRIDPNNTIGESNEADNAITLNFSVGGTITEEWALVGVDTGRAMLGDGTDVIVGTMDDAFDFNHPWVAGNDSLGRPRLIAADQNALGIDGGPINAGHATAVMGVVLANGFNGGDITGLVPDARYVSAEFINRADEPSVTVLHVLNAAGFLADNGAEVINMSWSWFFGSVVNSQSGEGSVTNLMVDYLSYGLNIVCVPAVNQIASNGLPLAPGAARNVITVGGLEDSLDRVWASQDYGPTVDGRGKPDLLGNDSANGVAPSASWRNGFPSGEGFGGTSFAAPFVTGAVAQMLDYGKHNGGNTDHRVIKAVVMTSGVGVLDVNGSAWSHSESLPLDDQQGTGVMDITRIVDMYTAGEQPRLTPAVPGYDFATSTGSSDQDLSSGRYLYVLGTVTSPGGTLNATLAWDRHTFWNDANTNSTIDQGDSFYTSASDTQDNLDLVLFRDGTEIAASHSTVDTVEFIRTTNLQTGLYELMVERKPVTNSGSSEDFALAWWSDGTWTQNDLNAVYVDFDYPGPSTGSTLRPFAILQNATTAVNSGGTVRINTGTTNETITLSKPMRLEAQGGPVLIGAP